MFVFDFLSVYLLTYLLHPDDLCVDRGVANQRLHSTDHSATQRLRQQ